MYHWSRPEELNPRLFPIEGPRSRAHPEGANVLPREPPLAVRVLRPFICAGGVDFVNDGSDPTDDNGHETHVAGVKRVLSWLVQGTNDANRKVTWTIGNAPSGCYTTTVVNVVARGWSWDGVTPGNSFCK